MEWSGLFGGRNDCGGKTAPGVRLLQPCAGLQQPDTLHNDGDLNWVQLSFLFLFRSSIVWWWKVNVASVSNTMSQCILLHWNSYFFTSFLTKNNFSISYFGCSKHQVQFYWCCMVQSFLCVWRLLYHLHVYYHYSGCLAKSVILLPKNSMCPMLPPI